MKQQKSSKAQLYMALFVIVSALLSAVTFYETDWIGVCIFANLMAGKILSRQLVILQMRQAEATKMLYPYAAILSVCSFVILIAANFVSHLLNGDYLSYPWQRGIMFHLLFALLFIVIYFFMTYPERNKSREAARMSKTEIERERYKINKALEDIKRAQQVLYNSPLY